MRNKVSGVISRQVLPACGNLCFFCPSLRARSRQPVKRYKKLIADIFPRNQVCYFYFFSHLTHPFLFGSMSLYSLHIFPFQPMYVFYCMLGYMSRQKQQIVAHNCCWCENPTRAHIEHANKYKLSLMVN